MANWKKIKEDIGNIKDGIYTITSFSSKKSLDVKYNRVTQKINENSNDVKWQITYVGGGEYKIVNIKTNLAMTIENGSHDSGAKLVVKEYVGSVEQKFAILDNGDGTYRIIASHSGKAIDLRDWVVDDNAEMIQWRYLGGTNQRWIIK